MRKLLQCEYKKTRRRYIFLTALAITVIQLCWSFYGDYVDDFMITNGWMMLLYQFPMVNAIFFPILSIVVSSRLCDIEHKGGMFKQLSVMTQKGSIYDAKFLFGLGIVLACVLISWCATIIFGYIKGFEGNVPIKLYLLYLLFTVVPTVVVYLFQHILSMLFKNQAVTFFAGVIGTFVGLFAMFLPNLPLVRRLFIWGYYGVLQFVGLFGWTSETRYEYAYFSMMDIDWGCFLILAIAGVVMYVVGRNLFCRKEV